MKMKTKNQDWRLSSKTKNSRPGLCTISALYLQHQQQQKTVTLRSHTNLFHKWNFCLSEYFCQLGVTEQQTVFVTNFVTIVALVLTIFIKHDLITWVLKNPKLTISQISTFQSATRFITQYPDLFSVYLATGNFHHKKSGYKSRKSSVIIQ